MRCQSDHRLVKQLFSWRHAVRYLRAFSFQPPKFYSLCRSLEWRQQDKQVTVLDFGDEFIQRARRRAADVIAYDVEMSIMAGTDVMLNVRMPADPTGEMSANVREYANIFLGLAQNKYAVIQPRPFPAVYFGSRELKKRGNPDWIFIEWAEIDDRFILRFAEGGREQISNRGKANTNTDQATDKSSGCFDEIAAAEIMFLCHIGLTSKTLISTAIQR